MLQFCSDTHCVQGSLSADGYPDAILHLISSGAHIHYSFLVISELIHIALKVLIFTLILLTMALKMGQDGFNRKWPSRFTIQ